MTGKLTRPGGVLKVSHLCDHPGCKAETSTRGLRDGWAIHWTHARGADGIKIVASRRRDYCPAHAAPYRDRDSTILEVVPSADTLMRPE